MRRQDKMPKRNKKKVQRKRSNDKSWGAAYQKKNPGSKLKTAVTGKVKPGSKAAKRRKSFCARSAGQDEKVSKSSKRS